MSTFVASLSGQNPLRMQLDTALAPSPTTFTQNAFLLEWSAATEKQVGGYGLPVLTREESITDFRVPAVYPTSLSGSGLSNCRVSYNISTSSPSSDSTIFNMGQYAKTWKAPSLQQAIVAGIGNGLRLTALTDGLMTWQGSMIWEER